MVYRDRGNYNFRNFEATSLYCTKCKRSVPVIKKLLLILPNGEKYDYICSICGTVIGDKIESNKNYSITLIK